MARVAGVRVAGKTGTAQNPHGQDHALFIAFAPVEAPTVALAVVVEGGGHGGSVAAPIARQGMLAHLWPDSLFAVAGAVRPAGAARAAADAAVVDTALVQGD
jgi:penicillin-binding protein 2